MMLVWYWVNTKFPIPFRGWEIGAGKLAEIFLLYWDIKIETIF